MSINTIMMIIFIVTTVAIILGGIYFYMRDKTLNEIRAEVYQKFLEAEHNPKFTKKGEQKMKWVLSQARMLLPKWVQPFITDALLEKVVKGWFKAVKDLLDDGKMNGSTKQTEEE